VARALEAAGDLYGAIDRVERLLTEYRAGRADTPGILLLLKAQCRLYRMVGDLGHSITIGENALAEVRGLGLAGTEDEVRLASTLVGSYWGRGDWARANQLAGEVIDRAEAEGSPRARASAYWNASLAASSVGRVGAVLLDLSSVDDPTGRCIPTLIDAYRSAASVEQARMALRSDAPMPAMSRIELLPERTSAILARDLVGRACVECIRARLHQRATYAWEIIHAGTDLDREVDGRPGHGAPRRYAPCLQVKRILHATLCAHVVKATSPS